MSKLPVSPVPASPMVEALNASAPDPKRADRMRPFGQLVGSWDIEVATLDPDGSWRDEKGEWHFGWILEGRAIQDVWITPSRGRRHPEGRPPEEYGTSIRLYDPVDDRWRCVWVGPILRKLRTFDVLERENELALVGTDDEGRPMHWVFSDVTERAFRWRSQIAEDGGTGWRIVQTMRARRQTHSNEPDQS